MQRSALYVVIVLLLGSNAWTGWGWWRAMPVAGVSTPVPPAIPQPPEPAPPPPPLPELKDPPKPAPKPAPKPKAKKQSGTKSATCAQIRWYLETFSHAELERMAEMFGVTEADRARARKCLEQHTPQK